MAQGDVHVFDAFLENVFDSGIHDFGATPNTIKCALITSATTPAITDTDPHFGGSGTTDLSTNQATGGNYTAGGNTCATASASLSGGALQLDFGDPATWSQNGSNPSEVRWGIIYDDTVASKKAIGYVDLGSNFDMTTGDLTITWGAPFATVNQT